MIGFSGLALAFAILLTGVTLTEAGTGAGQDSVDQLLTPTAAKPGPQPVAINNGEADLQAPDTAQDPGELRTTQALNAEITARNDLAADQERADQAAFEIERARHEAEAAETLRLRLASEEAARAADEARRRWEADRDRRDAGARAREAGNRARCAPPK